MNLKAQLLHKDNWREITFTTEWIANVPNEAGVYALKQEEDIVYVGETGNLKGRMKDLQDSRHHTVRRTIGERFFSGYEGFIQATNRRLFPEHIEVLVNNHLCTHLQIAFLPVSLGRKELEEMIQVEIKPDIRLNKRGKRKKS